MPTRRLLRLLAAALALGAPAARAAGDLETGIADDAAVLEASDPARAAQTVADWRAIGVDNVRLFAQWGRISPRPSDRRAPAGFDPADPASPGYDWSALDRAVALVRGAGMTVTLSVTGPGPLWATANPDARNTRLNPVPDLFGRFARAVARRYGAQVDRYILWNEPNLPLWLQPQFTCRGRSCTPASPHLYRRLVRAAAPAIHAADRTRASSSARSPRPVRTHARATRRCARSRSCARWAA
jgi:beta-glucosidase/6-phospho-beta-glucosidase/beta-galactosidase